MEFIKIVVIYSWAKQKFGGQSAEDVVQDFFFFFFVAYVFGTISKLGFL